MDVKTTILSIIFLLLPHLTLSEGKITPHLKEKKPKVGKVMEFSKQIGRTGCFSACKKIVGSVGLEVLPAPSLFQEALEEEGKLVKVGSGGKRYLDSLMREGLPAVVGVNHTIGYKIGGGWPNRDKTTDHFIVLVDACTYWDPGNGTFGQLEGSRFTITQIRRYGSHKADS